MDEQPAYFVKSVEKAFDVLRAFTPHAPRLTVSQVAGAADTTRASARRFLLTLADLGYLRADGAHFELTARSLDDPVLVGQVAAIGIQRVASGALFRREHVREELDQPDIRRSGAHGFSVACREV